MLRHIICGFGQTARLRADPISLFLCSHALQWLYGWQRTAPGGGVVARLVNQPINVRIAGWTVESHPADWEAFRARWWNWHLERTALSITLALLFAAIVSDRSSMR